MTKQQILSHPAWEFIAGLSLTQRYQAIMSSKRDIERVFDVTLSFMLFTELPKIPATSITLSVTDPGYSKSVIAVFTPKTSANATTQPLTGQPELAGHIQSQTAQ